MLMPGTPPCAGVPTKGWQWEGHPPDPCRAPLCAAHGTSHAGSAPYFAAAATSGHSLSLNGR